MAAARSRRLWVGGFASAVAVGSMAFVGPISAAAAARPASPSTASTASAASAVRAETGNPVPPPRQLRTSRPPRLSRPALPQANEFNGLGPCEQYSSTFDCWTPGEPAVAVGPNDIVETVNEAAAVYSKTGTKLAQFNFGTFFGGTTSNPEQCTDPRALYIASVDRFAISCSDNTSGKSDPIHFAISKTANPTGAWIRYKAPNTSFLDQDKIEATSDKFLVAGNTSTSETIYVYNLSDVVAGATSPKVVTLHATKSNVYEAVVQQTPTSNGYFVSSFPGNVLYLATITGTPAGTVSMTQTRVSSVDFPAPQSPTVPGGSYDGGDGRVLDAVYEVETSDSKPVIQYSSTRQCGSRDCLTSARIDLSGASPVLRSDTLVGEPGFDYTYGAVGLDAAGDVFEAYSSSDASSDPGAGVVGPGFDVPLEPAASGTSTCASGSSPPCFERWGDYLGTAIDPSNPNDVWVTGLYQAGNGGFAWGTIIAEVSLNQYALPTVVTGAASKLTTTTATVAGTVNPNGVATTYHFDYGLTTGYDSTSPTKSAGSGTTPVNVSAALTGLTPGTLYHYRVVATTATGSAVGADRTFRTPGPKITSVVFSGTPSNPTVTVNGSNFGSEPAGSAAGCGATGQTFGNSLIFNDITQGWAAGQSGDCIGLIVSSYTPTQVVFQFGSFYSNFNPVTNGDSYQMTVQTGTFSGTVNYT